MTKHTPAKLDEGVKARLEACTGILTGLGSVVVAYSGGVDSSLLLALAVEALGRRNVLAVMAVGTLFSQRDRRAGRELAKRLRVELEEIETPQLTDPTFTANPDDRCYHCKTMILSRLKTLASQCGFSAIVTGTNASDTAQRRPGLRAEQEFGVRQPLLEAGMTKDDIRDVARAMDLPGWDRPAEPCLATRIPYGQTITPKKLARIEQAEDSLRRMGFSPCRVRDHCGIARIEVPAEQIDRAIQARGEIIEKLKQAGYEYVTVDLAGFRSGSMDEALTK